MAYKNSACFASKFKQVTCIGDSGSPILFIYQNKVYLYAIIKGGALHKCQPNLKGTWRYPTVGARVDEDDITWISDQSGNLVKNVSNLEN